MFGESLAGRTCWGCQDMHFKIRALSSVVRTPFARLDLGFGIWNLRFRQIGSSLMERADDVFDDVRVLLILLEEEIGGVGLAHARGHEFFPLGLHENLQLAEELRGLRTHAYLDQ